MGRARVHPSDVTNHKSHFSHFCAALSEAQSSLSPPSSKDATDSTQNGNIAMNEERVGRWFCCCEEEEENQPGAEQSGIFRRERDEVTSKLFFRARIRTLKLVGQLTYHHREGPRR